MSEDELCGLQSGSHRRKSILQPLGSKRSKKSAAGRKNLPYVGPTLGLEGNDIDADDDTSSFPDKVSPTNEYSSLVLPSRTRSGPHVDSEPGPFQRVKSNRPHRYLELKLERFELPSTEPQGPGDLWTCAFRGCEKREHEASTVEGQERINSHFQLHAEQAQELIDLAKQESRPYLPVEYVFVPSFSQEYVLIVLKQLDSPPRAWCGSRICARSKGSYKANCKAILKFEAATLSPQIFPRGSHILPPQRKTSSQPNHHISLTITWRYSRFLPIKLPPQYVGKLVVNSNSRRPNNLVEANQLVDFG